jgi:hypothetical protein
LVKWLKEKWKALVAGLALFIVALSAMLRIRGQKDNFQNAKDAHGAELDANKEAEGKLVDGLSDISNTERDALMKLNDSTSVAEKELSNKKEDFAKDAKESKDLGKDIAKLIGAEFVETNDE